MSERPAVTSAAPSPVTGRIGRITSALDFALELVTVSLLVATVVIALIQIFWRYILDNSLSWPEEMARWAFVWLVFLGSAMLTHRQSHIVIDLLPRSLGPRGQTIHALAVRIVLAAVAALLVVYGTDLVRRSTFISPALEWPTAYLCLAIPVSAVFTLVFLAANPVDGVRTQFAGLLATLVGVLLFAALSALSDLFFAMRTDVTWTLLVLAIGLMMVGVPIADSLIFGAFVAFLPQGEMFLLTVPQNITASLELVPAAGDSVLHSGGSLDERHQHHRDADRARDNARRPLPRRPRPRQRSHQRAHGRTFGLVGGRCRGDRQDDGRADGTPGISKAVRMRPHGGGIDPRQHASARSRVDHLCGFGVGLGWRFVCRERGARPPHGGCALDRCAYRDNPPRLRR